MSFIEKVLVTIIASLAVGLLAFLAFIIYDVSTTTCIERGTIKRIVSVDGHVGRAVVELTDGSSHTITIGRIFEGKSICKTWGNK